MDSNSALGDSTVWVSGAVIVEPDQLTLKTSQVRQLAQEVLARVRLGALDVADPLNNKRHGVRVLDKREVGLLELQGHLELLKLLAVELAQPPVELTKDLEQYNARTLCHHPLSNHQKVASAVPLVALGGQVHHPPKQPVNVGTVEACKVR